MIRTNEEFLQKMQEIYGSKYDFSKSNYNGVNEDVTVICPIHGEFQITPKKLYYGKGCPKCSNINRKPRKTKTTEQFIKEAKEVHGDKYDYSKVNYTQSDKKVIIICPIHGEFEQRASSHLHGCGCKKCGTISGTKIKAKTTDQFIQDAKQIHKDYYDYSKIKYVNAYSKVEIVCPKHGPFWQTPYAHLKGEGCPICSKTRGNRSKGEKIIENWLKDNNIKYIYNFQIQMDIIVGKSNIILVDFYLPDYNLFIEYNGIQHYMPVEYFGGKIQFDKQQKRDSILEGYCSKNSIKLLVIKYDQKKEEIFKCLEKELL